MTKKSPCARDSSRSARWRPLLGAIQLMPEMSTRPITYEANAEPTKRYLDLLAAIIGSSGLTRVSCRCLAEIDDSVLREGIGRGDRHRQMTRVIAPQEHKQSSHP